MGQWVKTRERSSALVSVLNSDHVKPREKPVVVAELPKCISSETSLFQQITGGTTFPKQSLFNVKNNPKMIRELVTYLEKELIFWQEYQPIGDELVSPDELIAYMTGRHDESGGDLSTLDVVDQPVIENNIPGWPVVSEVLFALTHERGDPRLIMEKRIRSAIQEAKMLGQDSDSDFGLYRTIYLNAALRLAIRTVNQEEVAEIGGRIVSIRNRLWEWADQPQINLIAFVSDFQKFITHVVLADEVDNRISKCDGLIHLLKDHSPKSLRDLRSVYYEARQNIDHWRAGDAIELIKNAEELGRKSQADLELLQFMAEEQKETLYAAYAGIAATTAVSFGLSELVGGGLFYFLTSRGIASIRLARSVAFVTSLATFVGAAEIFDMTLFDSPVRGVTEHVEDVGWIVAVITLVRGPRLVASFLRGESSVAKFLNSVGGEMGIAHYAWIYTALTGIEAIRTGVHGGKLSEAMSQNAMLARLVFLGSIAATSRAMTSIRNYLYIGGMSQAETRYRSVQKELREYQAIIDQADLPRLEVVCRRLHSIFQRHFRLVSKMRKDFPGSVPDGYISYLNEWRTLTKWLTDSNLMNKMPIVKNRQAGHLFSKMGAELEKETRLKGFSITDGLLAAGEAVSRGMYENGAVDRGSTTIQSMSKGNRGSGYLDIPRMTADKVVGFLQEFTTLVPPPDERRNRQMAAELIDAFKDVLRLSPAERQKVLTYVIDDWGNPDGILQLEFNLNHADTLVKLNRHNYHGYIWRVLTGPDRSVMDVTRTAENSEEADRIREDADLRRRRVERKPLSPMTTDRKETMVRKKAYALYSISRDLRDHPTFVAMERRDLKGVVEAFKSRFNNDVASRSLIRSVLPRLMQKGIDYLDSAMLNEALDEAASFMLDSEVQAIEAVIARIRLVLIQRLELGPLDEVETVLKEESLEGESYERKLERRFQAMRERVPENLKEEMDEVVTPILISALIRRLFEPFITKKKGGGGGGGGSGGGSVVWQMTPDVLFEKGIQEGMRLTPAWMKEPQDSVGLPATLTLGFDGKMSNSGQSYSLVAKGGSALRDMDWSGMGTLTAHPSFDMALKLLDGALSDWKGTPVESLVIGDFHGYVTTPASIIKSRVNRISRMSRHYYLLLGETKKILEIMGVEKKKERVAIAMRLLEISIEGRRDLKIFKIESEKRKYWFNAYRLMTEDVDVVEREQAIALMDGYWGETVMKSLRAAIPEPYLGYLSQGVLEKMRLNSLWRMGLPTRAVKMKKWFEEADHVISVAQRDFNIGDDLDDVRQSVTRLVVEEPDLLRSSKLVQQIVWREVLKMIDISKMGWRASRSFLVHYYRTKIEVVEKLMAPAAKGKVADRRSTYKANAARSLIRRISDYPTLDAAGRAVRMGFTHESRGTQGPANGTLEVSMASVGEAIDAIRRLSDDRYRVSVFARPLLHSLHGKLIGIIRWRGMSGDYNRLVEEFSTGGRVDLLGRIVETINEQLFPKLDLIRNASGNLEDITIRPPVDQKKSESRLSKSSSVQEAYGEFILTIPEIWREGISELVWDYIWSISRRRPKELASWLYFSARLVSGATSVIEELALPIEKQLPLLETSVKRVLGEASAKSVPDISMGRLWELIDDLSGT